MSSTTLTPEQARALRVARIALRVDERTTETYARRWGAIRAALQQVADAFPEDGAS